MTRPPRWLFWLYRLGLGALPRRWRERYGEEMAGLFEDEWNDRSSARTSVRTSAGRMFFAMRSIVGLAVAAVALRSRPRLPSRWTRGLSGDLRLALRSLRRRPLLSITVVLTLAIGIGLTTAVFSIVNGLLLRPLPYTEPAALVQLTETAPDIESMDVSLPDFHEWRSRTEAFTGMFAFDDHTFLLATPDRPDILEGAVVSPGFLSVLGLVPTLGREFAPSEEQPGGEDVVMISHALWEQRFGGSGDVLGQSLRLNGRARVIVGVAPPGFHFPEVAHVWIPLAFDPSTADSEDYGYDVIARLAPGASLQSARSEGAIIAVALAAQANGKKDGIGATAYPLRQADVPQALGAAVLLLLAAVGLVLLVACSNVASLMLVRGTERRGEMAMRRALGAGGARLLRQQLAEVGVLAALGLTGAVLLARAAVLGLPHLLPGEAPFWVSFALDSRVLAWSVLMGLVSCFVVVVPTTLQALDKGVLGKDTQGSRVLSGRGRRWLVAAQVGLATLLVGVSGLALVRLLDLNEVETGVRTDDILVIGAALPTWAYEDDGARVELIRSVLQRVGAVPGVLSAGTIDVVPLISSGEEVSIEGDRERDGHAPVALLNSFAPGYFETMEIPVLSGRLPAGEEAWSDRPLAVVSHSLAERLWPNQDAVGRQIRHGALGSRSPRVHNDRPWLEVVAVVGDVLQAGPGRATRDELYVTVGYQANSSLVLVVRTAGDPLAMASVIRAAVHEVDPTLPFWEPTTMNEARRFSVWTERMIALLLTGFAGLAGVMAMLGIYAVVAHTTRERYPEIGLRLAIGASRRDVRRLVLGQSARLIFPALLGGLIAAAVVSVLIGQAVPGMSDPDPVVLLGAASLFALASLSAAFVPTWKASRVDPSVTLTAD